MCCGPNSTCAQRKYLRRHVHVRFAVLTNERISVRAVVDRTPNKFALSIFCFFTLQITSVMNPNSDKTNHSDSEHSDNEMEQDGADAGPSDLTPQGSDASINRRVTSLSLEIEVNNQNLNHRSSDTSQATQETTEPAPGTSTASAAGNQVQNPFQENTEPPQNEEVSLTNSFSQSQSLINPKSSRSGTIFSGQLPLNLRFNENSLVPNVPVATVSEPNLASQSLRKSARISSLKPVHYSAKSMSKNLIFHGKKSVTKQTSKVKKSAKKPPALASKIFQLGGPSLTQVIQDHNPTSLPRNEPPKGQRERKRRRLNDSHDLEISKNSDQNQNGDALVCLQTPGNQPLPNPRTASGSRDGNSRSLTADQNKTPRALTGSQGLHISPLSGRQNKQTNLGLQSIYDLDNDSQRGSDLPVMHGFILNTPTSYYNPNSSANQTENLISQNGNLFNDTANSEGTVDLNRAVSSTPTPPADSAEPMDVLNTSTPRHSLSPPALSPIIRDGNSSISSVSGDGEMDALDRFRDVLINTKFVQSNNKSDGSNTTRSVRFTVPEQLRARTNMRNIGTLQSLSTWQDYQDNLQSDTNPFTCNNDSNVPKSPPANYIHLTANSNLPVLSLQDRLDIRIYQPALMVWRELRNMLGREVVLRLRLNSMDAIMAEHLYPNWSVSYSPPSGLITTQAQAEEVVELRRRMARMQIELNMEFTRTELRCLSERITALKASLAAIYRTPMAKDFNLESAIDGAVYLANRERGKAFAEICRRLSAMRVAPEEALWRDLPDFVDVPQRAIRPPDAQPPTSPNQNAGSRRPPNRQSTPNRSRSRSQSRRRGTPPGGRGRGRQNQAPQQRPGRSRQNNQRGGRGRGRGRGSRPSRDSELLETLRAWFRDRDQE